MQVSAQLSAASRACRIHRFGPPEVITLEDIETPAPGEGEVIVRVKAAGVGRGTPGSAPARAHCHSHCR